MTYAAFEASAEGGQPIEIYKFTAGALSFLFASSEDEIIIADPQPVVFRGTYEPIAISRDRIQASADGGRTDAITVKMPSSIALAQRYVNIVPGVRTNLSIFRFHRGDGPLPEIVTVFKGDVTTVSFTENGRKATFSVVSLARAKSRTIPRFTYQGPCNHMLYDSRCKISEIDPAFEKFLTCSAIDSSSTILTVTGAGGFVPAADFFVSGFIELNDDFRTVIDQGGPGDEDLTILVPFVDNPVGQTLRVLAGCKLRLVVDCFSKFDNTINFGGFPFVPKKNPFTTGVDS